MTVCQFAKDSNVVERERCAVIHAEDLGCVVPANGDFVTAVDDGVSGDRWESAIHEDNRGCAGGESNCTTATALGGRNFRAKLVGATAISRIGYDLIRSARRGE